MNRQSILGTALCLLVVGLSACSSRQIIEEKAPEPATDQKLQQVTMLAGTAVEGGRGGAAIRQERRVHVLNPVVPDGLIEPAGSAFSDSDSLTKAIFNESLAMASIDPSGDAGESASSGVRAYSIYELSRWGRYCNYGNGMDERDWIFVTANLANGIPVDALGYCNQPKYDYDDYRSAWSGFCDYDSSLRPLDDSDLAIIRTTTRPHTFAASCPPLQAYME